MGITIYLQIKDWFDDRAKLDKEMNIPIPSVPVSENWCRLEEAWLMYGGMLEDEKLLSIICQWADVPIDETRAKVVEWNKRGVGLVWTYLGVMTIKQALEEVVASIPVKPLPGYEKHWEKISTLFVKNRYNMRSLFINQVLTLELGFTEKDVSLKLKKKTFIFSHCRRKDGSTQEATIVLLVPLKSMTSC